MIRFIRSRRFARILSFYCLCSVAFLIYAHGSDQLLRIAVIVTAPGLGLGLLVIFLDNMDDINRRHEERLARADLEHEQTIRQINADHEQRMRLINDPKPEQWN